MGGRRRYLSVLYWEGYDWRSAVAEAWQILPSVQGVVRVVRVLNGNRDIDPLLESSVGVES